MILTIRVKNIFKFVYLRRPSVSVESLFSFAGFVHILGGVTAATLKKINNDANY